MPPYEKQYPDFHLPPEGGGRRPVPPSPVDQAAARKKSLGVLAVVLIVLMAIIAAAGLDNLPRRLRDAVNAAQTSFTAGKSQVADNRAFIERAFQDDPDLFRSQESAWRARLAADQSKLDSAQSQLTGLLALVKANQRSDADKVEQGLKQFQTDEAGAVRDVEDLRAEAARWIGYKRDLPARLTAMTRAHEAIAAFDPKAAAPSAAKAMTDWPAKKSDIENRVESLAALKSEADTLWTSTAGDRAKAAESKPQGLDYGRLFAAGDRLDQIHNELKDRSASLNALAAQLYTSWDKLLLDVDRDAGRERVRIVRTAFPDASLQNGKVSEEERWEPLDSNSARKSEKNAGLVVERKAAGKYDSEAEHVAEAPAFAYIAPPGQSNAYGGWHNGVWEWLPQYLILRELLQPRYHGPITPGDWQAYDYARRRGDTWYGPGDVFNRSRGGGWTWSSRDSRPYTGRDAGGFYHERSTKPGYGSGGGFSGSRYESRGSFSGSRYQSRGSFGSRSYSRGSFGGGRGRR